MNIYYDLLTISSLSTRIKPYNPTISKLIINQPGNLKIDVLSINEDDSIQDIERRKKTYLNAVYNNIFRNDNLFRKFKDFITINLRTIQTKDKFNNKIIKFFRDTIFVYKYPHIRLADIYKWIEYVNRNTTPRIYNNPYDYLFNERNGLLYPYSIYSKRIVSKYNLEEKIKEFCILYIIILIYKQQFNL
jgi:hypothetical protein